MGIKEKRDEFLKTSRKQSNDKKINKKRENFTNKMYLDTYFNILDEIDPFLLPQKIQEKLASKINDNNDLWLLRCVASIQVILSKTDKNPSKRELDLIIKNDSQSFLDLMIYFSTKLEKDPFQVYLIIIIARIYRYVYNF